MTLCSKGRDHRKLTTCGRHVIPEDQILVASFIESEFHFVCALVLIIQFLNFPSTGRAGINTASAFGIFFPIHHRSALVADGVSLIQVVHQFTTCRFNNLSTFSAHFHYLLLIWKYLLLYSTPGIKSRDIKSSSVSPFHKAPCKIYEKSEESVFFTRLSTLLAQLFRVGLKRLNRFLNVWDVNVPVSSNLSPLLIQTP